MMKSILMCALLGLTIGALPAMGDQLPPGLQKKLERGQPLPPGWQKKLNYHEGDRFDRDLLSYGNIYDIDGHRQRVEIEDRVYTIIKDTREIIDILDQ
ncbi:hypothetical protein QQF73_00635 [Marinobacter sp. M216]|uniref:PepSY domain-containing protein n=1 Tax=Marinobacter albus TaxID=3030833 RepID=A0ABT7H6Y6_9GAMM|nr:hypothetical protein [Marinobacter sp. M216]MDK9556110.1 hypothetical protein [Marinobacter sp. M216]